MKFALVRRRAGEDTALHSVAVSTGPIYPPLGNYVLRVTMVHLRVIIGHLRVTVGHPWVTYRSPKGHCRSSLGNCRSSLGKYRSP